MNPAPVTLELPRGAARLVPLATAHAPGLLEALRHDPEIWRYMPEAPPLTDSLMTDFVERALATARSGAEVPFAIIHRPTGACAGSTRYLDIKPANRGLEIGWTWLGAPWHRTAMNTECKYLLLRHAFETLGAIRVQLKTDARNERSQRAIERIGARREGVLRSSRILHDGHRRDSVYFSVLEGEWPAVKSRLEQMLSRTGAPN